MKKTLLAAILMALLTASPAVAQTMESSGMQSGMQGDRQQQQSSHHPGQAGSQQQQAGGGQGMMGSGQGMMGGGQGMMQSQGTGPDDLNKYENFVNETRGLRRKLHNLKFEYGEAKWNPDTTLGDLRKMAEEMNQLQNDIQKKIAQ